MSTDAPPATRLTRREWGLLLLNHRAHLCFIHDAAVLGDLVEFVFQGTCNRIVDVGNLLLQIQLVSLAHFLSHLLNLPLVGV